MRKLYSVDYIDNGIDKHRSFECNDVNGVVTDSEIIALLHYYIGLNKKLSCVVEVATDMTLEEFNHVYNTPDVLKLPHRILYADMEEVRRINEMLHQ